MAEKIKKFFARKKADAKFKLAGPGHKLNESSTTVVVPPSKKKSYVPSKLEPSEAARQAAEAALVRVSGQKKDTAFNTSLAAIQAKVRRELEAEKKDAETASVLSSKPVETELDLSAHLAVKGVYFRCPLISDEVLSKEEWKVKIKEFLFNTLEEERGMTACLIIYSCNYNRTKVVDCVNVLCRYVDNILANPEETKFHKIRCSNATFNDKVLPTLGATEFLYAAGFRQQTLSVNDVEEEFWVWSIENIDSLETLQFLRETLKSEERVELEIDRNIQVLSPAQAAQRIELPQEFYAMSAEELKREKQQRSEVMEKQLQLRTKAMREKDEIREIRKYKFCLIRVRFPDGLYLQTTYTAVSVRSYRQTCIRSCWWLHSSENLTLSYTTETAHGANKIIGLIDRVGVRNKNILGPIDRDGSECVKGTFSVYEKFSEVIDFVRENLEHEALPFILNSPTGHKLEEGDKESTLADLRLVPATILMFQWDPLLEQDLKLAGNVAYLKPEVMILVQSM